ncbi:hypothetical protein LUZ60_000881 [Juncus effusus]|nr:hypothetical protein LUZ60_000881 [Juncus effusus]
MLVLICFLVLCICCRKRINSYIKLNKPGAHSGPIQFTYDELVTATTNFSKEIGSGASGEIFEGTITNPNTNGCKLFQKKIKVVVKRITGTKLGSPAYQSELDILNQLSHINLVQLIGYYNEDNCLLLVYEYMSNQSLDHHLYRDKNELKWPERYKIATGLATALSYLHEQYNQCIIYRDVKPSNVMLDSEFNAKLGDFGISKLVDHGDIIQTAITTGTQGYIAPEYYATGKASKESDIFSFGIVALEIACGTKPVANDSSLEKKVRGNLEWNDLLAVADVKLNGEFNKAEMERLLTVGLSCCDTDPKHRMPMREVVSKLKLDCDLAGVIIDHDKDDHV